ncbi:putative LRR receptor-like serine/threonine-protein kinase [Citrus sinensis]|nr:putative LRR receptor-like serine/threonine-protein kinase [Citrus sinensis]
MGIRVSCSFFAPYTVLLFYFTSRLLPHQFLGIQASTVASNETDRLALLQFKSKITHDPLGALGSWNASIHFCNWYGVTCSRRHQQRVTILDLGSLKLAGSITPHIGNLTFLKVLNLENNSFTHEIPSEIGRLRRLQKQLVGKLPSDFSSLLKIEFLSLGFNHLTGSIPSSFGNLTSIDTLYLSQNNLDGSSPDTLGLLKNLGTLALAANRLSGTIPSSIFNISSITVFEAGTNQIHGCIPLDIGFSLPNLQFFSVMFNQITGSIPPSISNASKLEVLQVTDNKLRGEVPYLEKVQRLSIFMITGNSLGSGGRHDLNFLCSLTNATMLIWVGINVNNFGGILPGCISNFSTTLEMFLLDHNKIFVNLQSLHMWNNQVSGTIPLAIGELQNLGILALDSNRLSGNIPPSIGNLKKLVELYVSDNFLKGSIPSSLGLCESLTTIGLFNNNLSGTIPPQLMGLTSLVALDLSRNQFRGSFPTEVGNLINLETLTVSGNILQGEIPSTLGSCIKLEILEMQGNVFQGPIPSSLSSLRGLTILDLSRNKLSGEIPEFLVGLKVIENLNLSYNDLEGMVPTEGVFKNASAISVLGNNKLCGGISEFKLPPCGLKKSRERRLTFELKLVIAIVSGLMGLALTLSISFLCWVRKRKEQSNPNSLINSLLNLSYQNLHNATDGFSSANLIGTGSFGSVYKGVLDEGRTTVTVKVFNLHHHRASRSFIAECRALRSIRHRNLVKVFTACSGVDYQGNDFKALVYEFMQNGSLEEWLYPVNREDEVDKAPRNLNLLQRLNIAIDVASALDYLHHDCQPITTHCDLKPSNILLDEEMVAHVGDFGLARFLPPTHVQTSSIGVKGSIGYIAPEYGLGSEVSTNGDVYSYGILMLELIIRKKPSDIMFEGDMNLHNFARMALPDHVMDIVDSTLLNDVEDLAIISNQRQRQIRVNNIIECLISMLRIGVTCSMESPKDRMKMTNVVHELQSTKNILLGSRTMREMQRFR